MPIDVMVVDDDPDIRGILVELLQDEGYRVAEAEDGEGLLELIEQSGPKLVLLDLTMPAFDAGHFTAVLRGRISPSRTAVVALSGLDEADEMAERLGLQGVVHKPFELDELLRTVRRYCEQPGTEAPAPF